VGRSPPVAARMPLAGAGDVSAVPAGSGHRRLPPRRGVEVVVELGRLEVLGLGDTELMDREVEEDFRATGLGHLLAVSGDTGAT
jgi:hypothetical protein